MTHTPPPPPHNRIRRALRLIAWNAALLAAAAALIAIAGETWLRRRTKPFLLTSFPPVIRYRGTYLWKPHAEIHYTNQLDFWTVSRVNSLGFLDREPPAPERAAAGCRIAFIGDSFVEALQVPIAQKSHVRLEALAAAALPRLNVTTSAFGFSDIGQIHQLAYYDDFARRRRPKLVVLVFVPNDFLGNHPLLRSLSRGFDPDYIPEIHAARRPDGKIELRPPHPDAAQFTLPRPPPGPPDPWYLRILWRAAKFSRFARRLSDQICKLVPVHCTENPLKLPFWVETLRQRPRYAALLERWPPIKLQNMEQAFVEQVIAANDPPPVFEDALDYTAFALEQFKQRADRDGAALVILAAHTAKLHGSLVFERMIAMAAALDIPVIDQADYILRQGAALSDAQWRHDGHWNADGHRWAAEALLEWLQQNPQVCAPDP